MLVNGTGGFNRLAFIFGSFMHPNEFPSYAIIEIQRTLARNPELQDSDDFQTFTDALGFDPLPYIQPFVPPPPPSTTRTRVPTQPLNIASTGAMFYASGGGGGKRKAPPSKETLTRQLLEEESDYEDLESHHVEVHL